MDHPLVWANINLNAIAANIKALKSITENNAEFMAVVKADAYGHGAVKIARTAIENGADRLGVARFNEAEELRDAGVTAPILIFGFTDPDQIISLAKLHLTPTIYDLKMAEKLSFQARRRGVKVKAHLKIDTGMGRVGMVIDSGMVSSISHKKAVSDVKKILKLKDLELEGIYTHFAAADSFDKTYSLSQLQFFSSFIENLKKNGITLSMYHAANSAGIIDLPQSHFNMVRAGIAIYGLYPSKEVNTSKIILKPAMELKTLVSFTKKVPKGFKVSYGMTYETSQDTVIASIPVGYADGFSRLLSSKGVVLVKGEKASIAGRVCMDQTLIDVGHIPGVKPGDEVVLMGVQKKEQITADEIAEMTSTINYEVVSSLTARVPKFYSGSASFSE